MTKTPLTFLYIFFTWEVYTNQKKGKGFSMLSENNHRVLTYVPLLCISESCEVQQNDKKIICLQY